MEARTLRYFLAVADAGTVSGAARAMHVTQPALSRQLQQLEAELRIDLFIREHGRLRLSSAGRQFLPQAQAVLRQLDQARGSAAALAAGKLDRLRIMAPRTTLHDVVVPFIATWTEADPFPQVTESVAHTSVDALNGNTDVVILTEPPPNTAHTVHIANLPLLAYVPHDHAWSSRRKLSVAELSDQTVVTLPGDTKPRQLLDAALDSARTSAARIEECSSAALAQAVAASGRGVAVVTDDPQFDLHPLVLHGDYGPVSIRLYAAWDPAHHAHATLRDVSERMAAFVAARYPTGQIA